MLGLTGSLYMLQVYDRVIPSHSVPTLIVLSIAMVGLYAFYGVLDALRLRLLTRIGKRFDRLLQPSVFALSLKLPLQTGPEGNRLQPISDLDQIRNFISSNGPTAFFDLPWLPIYLAGIYLLHTWLGLLATAGAIVSLILTLVAEVLTRRPARVASEAAVTRRQSADAARRNAEVVRGLGIGRRMGELWQVKSAEFLASQLRITDLIGLTGAVTRTWRMTLQSMMLGLGGYLVISGEASPGVIIASSIMLSRALLPIDTAIANWRALVGARQSFSRLNRLLRHPPDSASPRPAAADEQAFGRNGLRGRSRHAEADHTERHLRAGGRFGSWHYRSERVGQDDAGARPCWRLDAAARQGAFRRRRNRTVRRGGPGARHRLSSRRTWSCSKARSQTTSAGSNPMPNPPRSSRPRRRPG